MITTSYDGSAVTARLDAMPGRVRDELVGGIGRITIRLQRNVMKDKLSGQVLNVRTGRLRRSIGQTVEVSTNIVAGIVSSPLKYAPPHEYSFKGTVDVRAHLRQIKEAFGRAISPKTIEVSAHSMRMNLPERSFLRSALRDLEATGVPREEINAALGRAAT